MTDRETALTERWCTERPIYEAWGARVVEILSECIAKQIHPVSLDVFLRIPIKYRCKENGSLLTKAFHRNKQYADPYNDIEDKVGLRIVVLFSEEIRLMENIINNCDTWRAVKARDYEDERKLKPFEFDYQSVHYVVRSKNDTAYLGTTIPIGTPCEIQIRTILQHAYSEVTHDTIYKPSVQAEPDVKRAAAKSMALIEATDDYFSEVRRKIEIAQSPMQEAAVLLASLYKEFVGADPQPAPLNVMLIDCYKSNFEGSFEAELRDFLQKKPFLSERIRERSPENLLFRQPVVLLIYWTIKRAPRGAEVGLLSHSELEPFYSDLGVSPPWVRQ